MQNKVQATKTKATFSNIPISFDKSAGARLYNAATGDKIVAVALEIVAETMDTLALLTNALEMADKSDYCIYSTLSASSKICRDLTEDLGAVLCELDGLEITATKKYGTAQAEHQATNTKNTTK